MLEKIAKFIKDLMEWFIPLEDLAGKNNMDREALPKHLQWMKEAYFKAESNGKFDNALDVIANEFVKYQTRYKVVSHLAGGIPAEVVCAIHAMECSLAWSRILHNGERISDVNKRGTKLHPKGIGKGKHWSWEVAAIDALKRHAHYYPDEWNIVGTLNFLERYNGLGYRKYHPSVKSPYLWSGTQFYDSGKYTERKNPITGKVKSFFDYKLVSKQVGCVLILKKLKAF